jgi:hypothetical protein
MKHQEIATLPPMRRAVRERPKELCEINDTGVIGIKTYDIVEAVRT